MSFNWSARRVRSLNLPVWNRLAALRSCIRLFAALTETRYTVMLENLDQQFAFNRYRGTELPPPTDQQLLVVLATIERERNRHLEKRRAFERKRIRSKMRGDRQLSNIERALSSYEPQG